MKPKLQAECVVLNELCKLLFESDEQLGFNVREVESLQSSRKSITNSSLQVSSIRAVASQPIDKGGQSPGAPRFWGPPSNVAKIQHGCITKFTLRFTQLRHTLYPIMDTAIFHFKVDLRTTLSFETVHRSIPMITLMIC